MRINIREPYLKLHLRLRIARTAIKPAEKRGNTYVGLKP